MSVTRFRDRREAGSLLAKKLRHFAGRADAVVLGLPRGGVVTAYEIAVALDLPLDILVVRKLGAPSEPELAIGAIGRGGVRVLNENVVRQLHVSRAEIDAVAEREEAEVTRRETLFRDGQLPLSLTGRTVIVADDGLATGSTMSAAIEVLKAQKPARIVVAVPVAPPETCELLRREVDELVCLSTPPFFRAVGEWYDAFEQVSDEEVVKLLREYSTREAALAE